MIKVLKLPKTSYQKPLSNYFTIRQPPEVKSPRFLDVQLTEDEQEEECIYLCGNSLGLMPLAAKLYQDEQMMKWAQL